MIKWIINLYQKFFKSKEQIAIALEQEEELERQEVLREFDILKKYELPKDIITQEKFNEYIDDIMSKNYKYVPNIVRLSDLNSLIQEALNLKKAQVYITKRHLSHIRIERKGTYNQAINKEDLQKIPNVIREAKEVFTDTKLQNFFIIFDNSENKENINIIHFNADKNGNFMVTAKQVNKKEILKKEYKSVAVGVAPTILQSQKAKAPSTTLTASTTDLSNTIPQPTTFVKLNDTTNYTDSGYLPLKDINFLDKKGREHILTKETQELWIKTFNLKSLYEEFIPNIPKEVKDSLGKEVRIKIGSLLKIVSRQREQYILHIKPTLEKPEYVFIDKDGLLVFAKTINDKQFFTSVNIDKKECFISISLSPKSINNIKNKLKEAKEIFYNRYPNSESNSPQRAFTDRTSSINNNDNPTIPQSTKNVNDNNLPVNTNDDEDEGEGQPPASSGGVRKKK